jgi:hypothetical protein
MQLSKGVLFDSAAYTAIFSVKIMLGSIQKRFERENGNSFCV